MNVIEKNTKQKNKVRTQLDFPKKKHKRIIIKNEEEEEEEEEVNYSDYYAEQKLSLFQKDKSFNIPKGRGCIWVTIITILLSVIILILTGAI